VLGGNHPCWGKKRGSVPDGNAYRGSHRAGKGSSNSKGKGVTKKLAPVLHKDQLKGESREKIAGTVDRLSEIQPTTTEREEAIITLKGKEGTGEGNAAENDSLEL